MAEAAKIVEKDGKSYRVGHHPSSGYHIQEARQRYGHTVWVRAWSSSTYFGKDRARAEVALGRLAEIGSGAAQREIEQQTARAMMEKLRAQSEAARQSTDWLDDLSDAERAVLRRYIGWSATVGWEARSLAAKRIAATTEGTHATA